MKRAVRLLMWAHYVYLLLLPTLAVVAAQVMFASGEFSQVLIIVGFPPVLMFTLFLANGYAIPDSLPVALVVVLAIPLQIALSVFLFGGGSVWLFFAESAAVEIGAFLSGTLFTAFRMRRAEFRSRHFILLILLVLVLFGGGVAAYVSLVYNGYGGFSLWLIFFASAFAFAFWEYAKVYRKTVLFHRQSKTPETIVMTFDGGWLTKILGIKRDVPMISPFRPENQKEEMTKPILIFGFTAMFLPIVVGTILEVVRR